MSAPRSSRDPYSGVVLMLMAAAGVSAIGAFYVSSMLGNVVLLDVAVTLGISAGVLLGVVFAQTARVRPHKTGEEALPTPHLQAAEQLAPSTSDAAQPASSPAPTTLEKVLRPPVAAWIARWPRHVEEMGQARVGTAAGGALTAGLALWSTLPPVVPPSRIVAIASALCLGGAGLAAVAARYLVEIEPARLPESGGLTRGARVVAWILVLAAASIGLAWMGQYATVRLLHYLVAAVNVAVCYSLLAAKRPESEVEIFPLDLGVLAALGSRPNILASVLDAAEQQLGIDLRSTWALTVVRHSVEPLVIGLAVLAWITTSLTVVAAEEQGLVERLGVPVAGAPLEPGIHVHWPWPIDRVIRMPVKRIQALSVGHEGQEEGGPENVLWAVEHAANEYTLLLGNGRDLITVDAAVQYRIADARAWHYNCQNPADALRAIAYRAVMRETVNRTLADALSENLVATTARMRALVQQDADALRLGVTVVGFTVGGMHPPVAVAAAYQGVVSAQVGKVTAVINAQAFRNQTVPLANTAVLAGQNAAYAQGADELGRAAGEAWSFRTLQSQYQSAPQDYAFRRRLETLERGLAGRRFTIVDTRFQRDGGELWVIP